MMLRVPLALIRVIQGYLTASHTYKNEHGFFSDVRVRIWMLKNFGTKIQDGREMDLHAPVFYENGSGVIKRCP